VERQEHGLRSRGSARRLRTIHRRRWLDDERQRARARLGAHVIQAPAGFPFPTPATAGTAYSPPSPPQHHQQTKQSLYEFPSGVRSYPDLATIPSIGTPDSTPSLTARNPLPAPPRQSAYRPGTDATVHDGEGRWGHCGVLEQIRWRGRTHTLKNH
jgi:hypothetical protein